MGKKIEPDLFGGVDTIVKNIGAYAGKPGLGPRGKTCKDCEHYCRIGRNHVYLKCGLMESVWTHGPGTDIKAHTPACEKFFIKSGNGWK